MAAADSKNHLETTLSDATCVDRGNCACHADQDTLGRQFASHSDPHVRIIAHMSNRQLALSEQLGDNTKMVFKLAGAVSTLQGQVGSNTLELRRVGDALVTMTASLDRLIESVGSLTRPPSIPAGSSEELEEATTVHPS